MTQKMIWFPVFVVALLASSVAPGGDALAADKQVANSIKCRKQIGKEVKKMGKDGGKAVGKCHDKRNKLKRPQGDDCNLIETADDKNKFPVADSGNKGELKYDKNVNKKCAPTGEEVVRLNYPDNGNIEDSLIQVVTGELEAWAATLTDGPDLTDKKEGKDERKCQKEVFKQGQKILDTGLKEAVKCQDKIDKLEKKQTAQEAAFLEIDTGCMPSASEKVQKAASKALVKLQKKCGDKGVDSSAIGSCDPFPDCVADASKDASMNISDAMYGIPPECGNGFVETGEGCDDGDDICGDGCDPNCAPSGCGNGFVCVGDGEECDDGLALETGACPACMYATCEDGFVQTGVEICGDAADVCPFQTAECAPNIGTCPCAQGDCLLTATRQTVRVEFETAGSNPTSLQIALDYHEDEVGIPGFGTNLTVLDRVDVKAVDRLPFGGIPAVNDSDYSLIVSLLTTIIIGDERISDGTFFETTFDTCSGASLPTLDKYSCEVLSAFNGGNDVGGNTTCTVSILP